MDIVGEIITNCFDLRAKLAPRLALKSFDQEPRAELLEEQGILMLPNFLTDRLIEEINEAHRSVFDFSNPSELVFSPDGKKLCPAEGASQEELRNYYFLHISNYPLKFAFYQEILSRIAPILESYYRSHYYVRDAYCYRTQPVPAVQGSYAWHRDNYPRGSLKVMTYLTDVDRQRGPFTYALRSHRGFQPQLGKIGERYEEAAVKEKYEIFDCTGPRGSVIIFNNNGVHRATDPATGYRDVINFTVFPCIFPGNKKRVKGLDMQEEQTFLKKYTR